MLYLDFTTNKDYYDLDIEKEIVGIEALQVYSYEINFKTLVDESFSGNEQRRSQWTLPRRKWTLTYNKDNDMGRKFENFFIAVKGRHQAFKFKWKKKNNLGEELGGDDKWYFVRLDADTLKMEIDYYGYRVFTMDMVEVFNTA